MGFWLQRTIELGRELTLDLAGDSPYPAGTPPLSYAIPGTPLFYRDDIYVPGRPSVPPPSLPYLQIRPEVVGTSGSEQPFASGLSALAFGDVDDALTHLERAAEEARKESTFASIRLALALVALAQDRPADAVVLLRTVVASDESLPDDRMKKSLVRGALEVHVTRNLTVHTSMDRGGASLLFAELLQYLGRDTEAADLLETLGWRTQQPALALALADHYIERDLLSEVSRVTARFTANTDDLALQILLLRARARRGSGDLAFALATLEEALRFPDRDPHLLHAVHYERALTLEARGHEDLALRELGSIYDEDPGFRDVATRLSLLPKTEVRGGA